MAIKTIRIGSAVDIFAYDDAVHSTAVETDGVLFTGTGSGTDFTVVVAIQAGGAGGIGFQYKTRALTLDGGAITAVGAESGWNDV